MNTVTRTTYVQRRLDGDVMEDDHQPDDSRSPYVWERNEENIIDIPGLITAGS
jgi:hypothetical protein